MVRRNANSSSTPSLICYMQAVIKFHHDDHKSTLTRKKNYEKIKPICQNIGTTYATGKHFSKASFNTQLNALQSSTNFENNNHPFSLFNSPKINNYSVNTACATYTLLDKGFYYDENGGINFEQEVTINSTISTGTANVIFKYGQTPISQSPAITFTLLSSLQGSNVYKVEFKVVGPIPDNIWCAISTYKTKLTFSTNCITTPTVNTTYTAEKSVDPDIYMTYGYSAYHSPNDLTSRITFKRNHNYSYWYPCHYPTLGYTSLDPYVYTSTNTNQTVVTLTNRSDIFEYKTKTSNNWQIVTDSHNINGSLYDYRYKALLRVSPLLYSPYYSIISVQ